MKTKGELPAATLPETLNVSLKKAQDLRYGENRIKGPPSMGIFTKHFQQLHGKELSYNNILDLSAATELVSELRSHQSNPSKHTKFRAALAVRPRSGKRGILLMRPTRASPYGGVIAVNRPLDTGIAEAIAENFCEVIIAPEFQPEALAILQKKRNLL